MNRSIVVSRYASALLKYAQESGHGAVVHSEARSLVSAISQVPELRRAVEASDDVVPSFDRKKLLQSALGNRMSPEMSRFLTLLNQKGRMDMVQDILRDFVKYYNRSTGVRIVHLVTAQEPSERLLQRISALVKQKTGDEARILTEVDPSILGGFVLDLDDYLLDASVKHELDQIRSEFIERNRRII